jgi:NADH dehydrogenase (ubiquinone) 1 alpha subcomplex subunit 2
MKKNNPQTPIMLREAAGTLPKVYARYGAYLIARTRYPGADDIITEFGSEKAQSLEGLTDKQIEETVTGLVKNASA